jgi:hypothetical protein
MVVGLETGFDYLMRYDEASCGSYMLLVSISVVRSTYDEKRNIS